MVNAFNDVNYTDETYKYSALWAINEVRKECRYAVDSFHGKKMNSWNACTMNGV